MRVLFDHGTPSGIARSLSGHDVTEAMERGWDRISNGELLKIAEAAGARRSPHDGQTYPVPAKPWGRKIAIVVLRNSTWRIVQIHLNRIARAVNEARPGSYIEVDIPFK